MAKFNSGTYTGKGHGVRGTDVILVEKQGIIDGSSICCEKIIASVSEVQKKQDMLDTPQMLYDFLIKAAENFWEY